MIENGSKIPYLYEPQFLLNGDQLIYSFASMPDFFVYDLKDKSLEKKMLPKSALANVEAEPIEDFDGVSINDINSTMIGMRYSINSVQHFQPVWDKYREVYYRISKVKDTKGSNDFLVKRFGNHVLTVLDSDFNFLGEIKLPDNFDASVLVTKDRILIPLKSQSVENTFELGELKIDGI